MITINLPQLLIIAAAGLLFYTIAWPIISFVTW